MNPEGYVRVSQERALAIAGKALQSGAMPDMWRDSEELVARGLSPIRRRMRWDVAMNCERPRFVIIHGRESAAHGQRAVPYTVEMTVRCRKCPWCTKMRQRLWMGKAYRELEYWPRHIFGTLTARPEEQYRLECAASVRLEKTGVNFDGLPEGEKFKERCYEFGAEVTRWIKRVRKGDSLHEPRFRYLLIAEAHDSADTAPHMRGKPHVHCLIHEMSAFSVVRPSEMFSWKVVADHALIRAQWNIGHSRFELARDTRTAVYLCKYLSKSMMVRVRASQRYGEPDRLGELPGCAPIGDQELCLREKEIDPPQGLTGDLKGRSLCDTDISTINGEDIRVRDGHKIPQNNDLGKVRDDIVPRL